MRPFYIDFHSVCTNFHFQQQWNQWEGWKTDWTHLKRKVEKRKLNQKKLHSVKHGKSNKRNLRKRRHFLFLLIWWARYLYQIWDWDRVKWVYLGHSYLSELSFQTQILLLLSFYHSTLRPGSLSKSGPQVAKALRTKVVSILCVPPLIPSFA